ncbi:LOW QUALITY PROTEIN: lamin-C [Manduca sexta]|uniref:LOW QUALITY PROTEIN: lamin-C n=1 Tax=Manduca sexta TaxID=7130 RepID=UPI0018905C4C|nr:LOW QUALITY PROTEIN: lamin-C [Manduca sexta]
MSKVKKTVTSSTNVSVVSSVQSPTQTSTPIGGGGRPNSPLSPTRHTRLQEKDALQNLNDRLAAYIDKVRQLESENSGLRREIQTTQEVITREVSNIKGMYEHELQDARKLLDDTSREKAKLEIDSKRLYEENDDLKKRLDKKTKDLAQAENLARHYESRYTEENNKYNSALADKKKAQDEARELAKELEKLRKVYADTRKTLEEEMLCRIDMENTVQSLREELSFKDQVFQQELQETRTRRQVEISEIDGRLAQQYEAKLQQSLQELREQQEANIKANRDEIEALYENKLKNLQAASNRNSTAATVAVEELRTMRSRLDTLNSNLNELENKNAALSNRCRELERQLESERARHAEDLASLEQELARLRDEMAAQLREYATLMDIKISLDHEIATYRALIEGEEDRLNLTSQSPGRESRASASGSRVTPSRRATPLRATRKRTLLDESEERSLQDFSVTSSAKLDLEVAEADPDGNFVKIRNTGKKEISLGGFQIMRKAGEQETLFKFHRTVKLEPGAVTTVWSADSGATNDPPRDIVMKGQKWFVADTFTTALLNTEQEIVAMSKLQRRQFSMSEQRRREIGHKYPRREPTGEVREGDENCRIM